MALSNGGFAGINQFSGKKMPELQHLKKLMEEVNAAEVGETGMITCDS